MSIELVMLSRKKLLLIVVWAIVSLCQTSVLHGQITGGYKNGERTPTESKPAEITSGAYQGDVNLFTGTYSSSYPLGRVSTPTGLGFDVNLTYGGVFSGGTQPPHVSGVPYGEGWNISIPTISVENDRYEKYTASTKANLMSSCDNLQTAVGCLTYSKEDIEKEGNLEWFAPTLSIPGIASGRLVFKRIDGEREETVFVLQAFDSDSYVEAVLKHNYWVVKLPNGDWYTFKTMQVADFSPTNQRTPPDPDDFVDASNWHGIDDIDYDHDLAKATLQPKVAAATWYVSSIENVNFSEDQILFNYQTFGEFDYHQEYAQPLMMEAIQYAFPSINPEAYQIITVNGIQMLMHGDDTISHNLQESIDNFALSDFDYVSLATGSGLYPNTPHYIGIKRVVAFRDIFLRQIVSRSGSIYIEKMDFEHKTITPPQSY